MLQTHVTSWWRLGKFDVEHFSLGGGGDDHELREGCLLDVLFKMLRITFQSFKVELLNNVTTFIDDPSRPKMTKVCKNISRNM